MVLGKGGGNAVGTLISIIIFGVITCAGLGGLLGDGREVNPVFLIFALIIGLVFLSNLVSAFSTTRVVLDAHQNLATRTHSIFFIPTQRQEMAFNLIREVRVSLPPNAGATMLEALPLWQVQLRATDGSTLLVNERGTHGEMHALGQQVGTLLNRPVRDESERPKPAQAATSYTPAAVMGSLFENLADFAQSFSESTQAPRSPTLSAFPETTHAESPFAEASERLEQRQAAAKKSAAEASARADSKRASAFTTDAQVQQQLRAEQMAAGVPFVGASARLAYQQATTSATGFSLSAPLDMPQMPPLFSFGPALDMPSFPPIGAPLGMFTPALMETQEIKHVEAHVSAQTPDARALQRQARQMFSAHNYHGAQEVLQQVLNMNPADAAAQNDLGVAYWGQHQLADAEQAFRRAMALDPFSNASRYNLGVVLTHLGKTSQAHELFRVGAQSANRDDAALFHDALRGGLREPMLSESR